MSHHDLTISSLNARGLSNKSKRREVFQWLRKKHFSVFFLQEAHCTKETENIWRAEWGYQAIFSSYSSESAGVCILFNNNFGFEVVKQFSDPEGRFILCDIKTDSKITTLLNIYAPNNDDPIFFEKIYEHLNSFECEEIVFGGDFNLVLDLDMDKEGGNKTTHKNALKVLNSVIENLDLVDIWRVQHPQIKRFTWRRRRPNIQCRLDFFLVSNTIGTNVIETDILPGYKTDHSLITISLSTHSNPRGPGFWKLNTSFLSDNNYIKLVKQTISNVSKQYEHDNEVDEILLWEMIKMQIRADSITYAKQKNKERKNRVKILESKIADLQNTLEENKITYDSTEVQKKLEKRKRELESIIEHQTRGAILRSQTRWYNEGEKNTKYFLSLEKRHVNQKTIKSLKLDNDVIITSDKEILHEARMFYKSLYTSKVSSSEIYDDLFFQENNTKLDDMERNSCEGELTSEECLIALKSMDNSKTPGSDGLPADFYKVFWEDIKSFLVNALNAGFHRGTLSISQRRGLITLLPKKDKILYRLKNWRPISLLNCDYKIATKAIATRMKKVLPNIINFDQSGFLKGRFIGENIRLIDSVINYTDTEDISGLLLFVDFEKAFDTLEWSFITKTLKHYNFGPSLIAWITTFYSDISSTVLNNGWSAEFFHLSRGVRQGCPLSPYLFILCAEVLSSAIRKEKSIKGIHVLDTECKISQYADDTTLLLDGSELSLQKAFELLDKFGCISGLKVNYEKTEALWIGKLRHRNNSEFTDTRIKWAKGKVKALGVWFSTLKGEAIKLNFEERKENINNTIENWHFRRLTLLGKISVIKSLLASQLVYILTPLPSNFKALEEINKLLYKFLWNGKGDSIKRSEMVNNYENGGLKMLDIKTFNCSLKSIWIKTYLDNSDGKWKRYFDYYLLKHGGKTIFSGNLNMNDVKHLNIKDEFLFEVLNIWVKINYKEFREDFLSSPLWHNSSIKVANHPIFFKEWSTKCINYVKDLMGDDQTFMTMNEFIQKYKIKTNFLEYHGVLAAVQDAKRRNSGTHNITNTKNLSELLESKTFSREVYKILISGIATVPYKSQNKWAVVCDKCNGTDIIWQKAYTIPFTCTKEIKLRGFQFKFLHRRIATNDYLYRIGAIRHNNCTFCNAAIETLEHLFWECSSTQRFWKETTAWLFNFFPQSYEQSFSMPTCLGLVSTPNMLIDHILLMARHHIYVCKIKGIVPELYRFKYTIFKARKIELRIACQSGKTETFYKKWKPLQPTDS